MSRKPKSKREDKKQREVNFPVVLFVVLCKELGFIFYSVHKILSCDHQYESIAFRVVSFVFQYFQSDVTMLLKYETLKVYKQVNKLNWMIDDLLRTKAHGTDTF